MRKPLSFRDAVRKGPQATGEFLLFNSITAHALLNLADSANDEECRFRAILKAEEVLGSMDTVLASLSSLDEQRQFIEKSRYELQTRLSQALR